MMSWYSKPYYPASSPRKALGGLKLRSKSGEVADTWWGQRWTQILESFGWHTRLERGRRYARQGQVVSVKVEIGQVLAQVQGSRAKPYAVKISLHALSRKDWSRVADTIARQAFYTAKLLSGEMPHDIEKTFADEKLALFPQSRRDLSTDCSCPDWENPCKHIAAVYYILAQEFDRDPFLLFKLRGISRGEFLSEIRSRRGEEPLPRDPDQWIARSQNSIAKKAKPANRAASKGVDFSKHMGNFFQLGKELPVGWGSAADLLGRLPKPGGKIHELGTPPFWRGELGFELTLKRYYQSARDRALALMEAEQ
jgi:uncharacterized Zn finger protein